MDLSSLWLIVICATFGFAWWLSRRDMRVSLQQKNELPKQYFIGLKHLLNEQPDLAIDAFIQVAKLDPRSVELHLSLGQMFRRQGEFARAIRLNTYLSERTDLTPSHQKQVRWHLAQDYYKAGMYDRAENILKPLLQDLLDEEQAQVANQPNSNIVDVNSTQRSSEKNNIEKSNELFKKEVLDLLLKIATWEQDWQKASEYLPFIDQKTEADQQNAEKLSTHISLNQYENQFIALSKKYKNALNIELSTSTSELTNIGKELDDLAHAISKLHSKKPSIESENSNQSHPRALILLAQIQILQQQEAKALSICQELLLTQSHLYSQILPLIEKTNLDLQQKFWQKYVAFYLDEEKIQLKNPLNESAVYIIFQQNLITHQTKTHFLQAALDILEKPANANPTIVLSQPLKQGILNAYLETQKKEFEANTTQENTLNIPSFLIGHLLTHLQNLAKQQKSTYICESCGFLAKNFSWSCPGCREWDTLQKQK